MTRKSRPFLRAVAGIVCAVASVSCGSSGVTFEYRGGGYPGGVYTFSRADRHLIETVAERAIRDVRMHLDLPPELTVTVVADPRVIPETGESGSFGFPSRIYWIVEPAHEGGVRGVVQTWLRPSLFHELYHLVRERELRRQTLVDYAVSEGMATVFERDFAGATTPWGAYPADVEDWTRELLALPEDAPRQEWMSSHPDGRRWIGYKVGTYLADRAVAASGLSIPELVTMPTSQIVEWALP